MLPEFAKSLYERFDREGIPLLLAGGWAVCHHGYSRLTVDVDWVCPRSREADAIALMRCLHFDKCTDGMASRFKSRKHAAFPYVDLIWVDDASFEKMVESDHEDAGKPAVPAINFRSLLAMKLHALKDGETRDHKDLLDIRSLLRYGHTHIPEEELKALCERYAGHEAYEKIRSNG
jgi:Nucleotidyl transferase AbiEii toxin, Type IV TA system